MHIESTAELSRRKLVSGLCTLAAASALPASLAAETISDSPPVVSLERRKEAIEALTAYFRETAPQLLRPAEGILKHRSIAPSLPGKQYSTSLWDWDSLWTVRGLFRFATLTKDDSLQARVGDHALGSLMNFLDHQSDEGRLSIMIDVHNADPFGCLKKASPNIQNQAKPVFAQLALTIADELGSVAPLAPLFDKIQRFHSSWVLGNRSATGLLVWGDDVAIGNDNDPTTFGRPFFSSANLLLNCLFFQDLRAAAELAQRLGRSSDAARISAQADALGSRILKLSWDPRDRFFYTVDVQCVDRRAELIPAVKPGMDMSWNSLPLRIQTFTGFLPLWCGLATAEQARQLIETNYLADDRLRSNWGVRTLSRQESMYSLQFSSNPSNWLGPIWIIGNYFAWKALKNYGFSDEADRLRDKTLLLLSSDLARNGSLNEYYHPDTGDALSHRGFMDWNLLVLEMI